MKTIDSNRLGEMGITGGMAVVALVFFTLANFKQTANPLDPGPSLFPVLISSILLIMCVCQFVVSYRQRFSVKSSEANDADTAQEKKLILKYVFGTLALTIVYIFLFTSINYLITTTIFMFGLLSLLGIRKWKTLLLVPVLYTAISFILYNKILMVPLP